MRHNFDDLRQKVHENPERRARVEEFKRAMEDAIRLADVRESRAVSQGQLAETMCVSQARVSQIERSRDLYLSTLGGYVAALGGRLRVSADFEDETVDLYRAADQGDV